MELEDIIPLNITYLSEKPALLVLANKEVVHVLHKSIQVMC